MLRTKLIVALTLLALTGISLAAAGAFAPPHTPPAPPAPPTPPAPSITTRPADPTDQASAHFAYADAQAGVSYECQLDRGSFAACPAGGVTYSGPLGQGSHTFNVRALFGTKTSDASTYSWTVDTTPPTATISYPGDGATLAAAEWGARCRGGAICGSAHDANGVSAVLVSLQQQSSGRWWDGHAFEATSETLRQASVDHERDSTGWSYALALPSDGRYVVHARAIDDAGNTTAAANEAIVSFTIDTTPPPAPSIGSGPQAETTARAAAFTFTDAEHGARLLCRRDGARFAPCASPQSYQSLSLGAHHFEVEALDAVGNTSADTGASWKIVKAIEGGKPFTVAGNVTAPLAPSLARPLAITVTNPNGVPIEVTTLSVAVAAGSSNAGCDGPSNLKVTQSNISSANALTVPANGHVTLPSGTVRAPEVLMLDLPVNQNACKGATFKFTYSGSAHS
jgi:hypothetical protein